MCPGKSARQPAQLLTLPGSLAHKAPPSREVKNKSCLWEALKQTDQTRDQREAAGRRKVRIKLGKRLGWEAGTSEAENPRCGSLGKPGEFLKRERKVLPD